MNSNEHKHDNGKPQTGVNQAFEKLRTDPQYEGMARKMGITPAQTPEQHDAEKQKQWGRVNSR